jgi:hypothetical protein
VEARLECPQRGNRENRRLPRRTSKQRVAQGKLFTVPLSWNEIKSRALNFSRTWADAANEGNRENRYGLIFFKSSDSPIALQQSFSSY